MRQCCNFPQCGNQIRRGYKCDSCKITGKTKVRRCRDCNKVVKQYQRCPEHRRARAALLRSRRQERAKKALVAA